MISVPKSQVLAYTNGRGEHEIILDPATLQAVRVTALRQPTWVREGATPSVLSLLLQW
jgi:hypothetical protein